MAELATLWEFNQQGGQGVRATQNKNLIEQLFDGEVSISVASGHVTLTTTPLDTAQTSYATIRLTGAPGAARNVLLPSGATGKRQFINDTTGGQTITVKTTAGGSVGVAIPADGKLYTVYSDGTDCELAGANGGDAATLSGASLDTDGTLAANSDSKIPSQKAVKTYVGTAVTGLFDDKGDFDASANPNYPAASKGDVYRISVAGRVGGASGKIVGIGDFLKANADNAGGTEASVGTSWSVWENNIPGLSAFMLTLLDDPDAVTALATLTAAGLSLDNIFAGTNRFQKSVRRDSDTPAQITGNQNNYTLGDAPVQRLSTDASRNITGIVAFADGAEKEIENVGSFNIVLTHEDVASTAANRITLPNSNATLTIVPGSSTTLRYDGTTTRWRIVSRSLASGTAAGTFAAGNDTRFVRTLNYEIGDGVVTIPAGIAGRIKLPASVIATVELFADVSGSIVIDLWRDSYANIPPVVGDSITASAKPTLSSAQKSTDSTLTGWSKTNADGDWLVINVDSATTIKKVALAIVVTLS